MKIQLPRLSAPLLLFAWVISSQAINGQSPVPVIRQFVWSQPGNEIQTPQFSTDGNFLVVVTRAHWPDGHEAEGLPDSFFKNLESRAKAEPRFADPIIKVIDLKGNVVCEVKYGWNPSLSQDNRRLVFSEQVKPITGFRELAATKAGNGIRIFDCETKELTKIADPETGYLEMPIFSPDGGSIVYEENEAVNGEFGGPVAITQFDLQQKRQVTLLEKEMVPSVPCPPANSGQSRAEAFICSQVKNLTSSFPQMVFHIAPVGGNVVALLGMPIPAAGDMYMAQNYEMKLVSTLPEQKTIFPLGKRLVQSDDITRFKQFQTKEC